MSVFTEEIGRRKFLKSASIVGAASAALVAGGVATAQPLAAPAGRRQAVTSTPAPVTDVDIANFALNLEYLEAEFYTMATTGQTIAAMGIAISGTGTPGPTTGGALVPFNDPERLTIAKEIADDERAHVQLLRQLLGSAAVAKPAINLNALGIGFANRAEFLTLARAFEDTGVSAYGGAAPFITSELILGVAARILAAEGEHTANIRYQLLLDEIDNDALGALDSADLPVAGYRYFSTTSQGLTPIRSPRQVLDIVFHCTGCTSGGFFPNGVNSSNLAGLAAIPAPNQYVWQQG
ncbi:MAG: ferritin-like domain-containing protein [Terriglobales bacterium]